ncbi:MAG: sensor histidine kinase, partial [Sphingobium sp.]
KRMDVAALVETLVDEQQQLGRDVTMATQTRVVAEIQPDLLRRAVTNLLDNAVKYGGGATASVTATSNGIEIRIADEGPGIPDDQMASVLEPFYRVEGSRNRDTGGVGLGLAIARSVAENHGGELRLERADPAKGGLAATIALPA